MPAGLPPSPRRLRFFLFEVPKVLMLLVLIVFAVGIIRTYLLARTDAAAPRGQAARRRQRPGRRCSGIVTPFCSCSAVPLFIGFVEAGIPLGVTFSFLIAAPMINEVAARAPLRPVRLEDGAALRVHRARHRHHRRAGSSAA
ncbi:MAG: permease [Candidatus Moduliflexus flocculans]|nr:permease [Candidatus Moduliflexus flocculans]